MDSDYFQRISVSLVLNSDLGLCVRSQPWDEFGVLALLQFGAQLVGVQMGNWVEFGGFVGGVPDHETLIPSSDILVSEFFLHGVVDFLTLLVHCDDDGCDSVIHTDSDIGVSDFFNGFSGDLFDVDLSSRVDFSENHTDVIFDCTFTCYFCVSILSEISIKDGI